MSVPPSAFHPTPGGRWEMSWRRSLDGCFQLHDAAVEDFFLSGGNGVAAGAVAAAAADAVALYSSRGKGGFNLREEFLDIVVLTGEGPSELVERPLEDLVPMCGGCCQVVEMGVEIVGQVRALGENAGFFVERGRVGDRDDVLYKLCGGCHAKRILPPL